MQILGVVADQTENASLELVTGVGVVLFLTCAGAFWAAIHLRGDTVNRLWSEIDFAFEALTEQAVASLEDLRSHIDELLPGSGVEFDPLDMLVDPSSVEKPAKISIKLLRERHRIRRQYAQLLGICSSLKYLALICTISIALATASYHFLYADKWLWQSLSYATLAIFGISLLSLLAYSVLIGRIDGVIEKCKPKATRAAVPLK